MIKIKKYQIEDYISDATQDALDLKADLVDGKVPASQLPSFVDDVIEVANYAALPIPGASGVIYITLDTNKVYRWTGSVYVEIASGVTNLSYTPGVSNGTVNSDTGSDAIIPLAGTVNAGLFSAAEKSKLDGIAPNANVGVIPNAPITGATKTKITYDTKGLVTAGADATTADISDSTNKRYVTDANLTVINNTSGTNTGDQGLQSVTDIGATTTNSITVASLIKQGGTSSQILAADGSVITAGTNITISGGQISSVGSGGVTSVTATSPITSSGGTTPVISTSMATNKLIGRSTTGTGVMEEIIVGSGLTLSAGTLTNTATPTPTGYYLAISDSTDQTNPTANTPRAVKFNTIDLANGFSLQTETAVFTGTINNGGAGAGTILNVTGVASGTLKVGMVLTGGSITAGTFISAFTSGTGGIGTYQVSVSQNIASATYTGTMTSEIVCANTGVYNIQFSSQMDKSDAGVDYVNFWLRKNGVDLPESAGVISLQGNAPAYMMAAWNYLVQLIAGDVIELYWGSADVNMEIIHEPAQTSPFAHPAIQSTILTITQQSGIMAGTGITGVGTSGNIQTGTTQTLTTNVGGTDFNIVSSGNTHTFNLPSASATARGVVTTGTQSFAGSKTLLDGIRFGSTGSFNFYESSSAPYFSGGVGGTLTIGGGPGGVQNNLAVPNGTFNIGLQTASTIASFDANKNVVSLTTANGYPTLTELKSLVGISTTAIQTQLNGKQPINANLTSISSLSTTSGASFVKVYNGAYFLDNGNYLTSVGIANLTATGTPSSTTYLRGDNTWSSIPVPSQSAYTVLANNTNASAVPTEQVYKDVGQQTYTATPTWSTSAPTTILANTYEWSQIGSTVNVRISLSYNTGAVNSSVILPMPADMPTPASITGFTGALDVLSYGSGMMLNATTSTAVTGARNCLLRRNAANTGYEFFVNVSITVTTKVVIVNLTYFA